MRTRKEDKEFRPIVSTFEMRKEFGLLYNLLFGNHVYFSQDSIAQELNKNPISWNIMNNTVMLN